MDTATAERLERERRFHDERYGDASAARESTGVFYQAVPEAGATYRALVESSVAGRVLEYGCGAGALCHDLVDATEIHAIDISPVAIAQARHDASSNGLIATFHEMNAEALEFDDSSFDLVYGSGILHHLDIESAASELERVIRPGGRAVFLEPMGYNPLINWYRDRTPEMRTDDEHPLVRSDFETIDRHSTSLTRTYFGLAALAAVPMLSRPGGRQIRSSLAALDRLLLSTPLVQELGWVVILEMRY